MNDKDVKLLAEAYEKIEEGMLDRLQARASGATTGLGTRFSNVKTAVGNVGRAFLGRDQKALKDPKVEKAKIRAKTMINSFVNDLDKLGWKLKDGNKADVFVNTVMKAIEDNMTVGGQPAQTPQAPAQTPQAPAAPANPNP